jgi:hypothetical protein
MKWNQSGSLPGATAVLAVQRGNMRSRAMAVSAVQRGKTILASFHHKVCKEDAIATGQPARSAVLDLRFPAQSPAPYVCG